MSQPSLQKRHPISFQQGRDRAASLVAYHKTAVEVPYPLHISVGVEMNKPLVNMIFTGLEQDISASCIA
jgi:hypothetical protein